LKKVKVTKVARCVPAVLWMGVIYWLSGRVAADSSVQSEGLSLRIIRFIARFVNIAEAKQYDLAMYIEPYIRDVAHILEYIVLFILLLIAVRGFTEDCRKAALISLFICFLYSCTDEWHQKYVPGRAYQWVDILLDTAGAAAAMIMYALGCLRKRRRAG
jgi:VanZ family protein